ncbi:MAG: hypothetical protein M1831_000025 [Alyxoria varia]|nr:MAG: hypothetical protein M1831_000025 [Alyxoria varia]
MPSLQSVANTLTTAAMTATVFLLAPQSDGQYDYNSPQNFTNNVTILSEEDTEALRIMGESFRYVTKSPWFRILSRLLTWDPLLLVLMALGAITLALCMAWLIFVAPVAVFHRYFGYMFERQGFTFQCMIQDVMSETAQITNLNQNVQIISSWLALTYDPMMRQFAREERVHRKIMRFFNAHPNMRQAPTGGSHATDQNNQLALVLWNPVMAQANLASAIPVADAPATSTPAADTQATTTDEIITTNAS